MTRNLLKALVGIVLLHSMALQANNDNPHAITETMINTGCPNCHVNSPGNSTVELLETKNKVVKLTDFKSDGVSMCSGCHNPDDGHKIRLKLDFEVPVDMPLDKKNTLSCLTCHYTHGKLTSERPQASFSFMDRLVDAERLHKSFLLRRNNVDGELCLICHNPDQGKK